MNYIEAIKTAIFVFPTLSFFLTIPFIFHQYRKYGSISKWRALIIYSFVFYLLCVYFLVILPLPKISEVTGNKNMIRLQPFAFVLDFIYESPFRWNDASTYFKALMSSEFYVPFFNILMTIPFGMYLRYYFKCNLKKTILYSFFLSLFFELTQLSGLYFIYPHPYRLFDLDDLILNTTGGVCGYFIVGIFMKFLPSREKIDEAALKKGEEVSGLRRFLIFCLDLFWICLISLFLLLLNSNICIYIIVFLFYYVIIPYCKDGYTSGSKFLKVRFVPKDHHLMRYFLRTIFLFFYYFLIPFGTLYLGGWLYFKLNLNALEALYYFGILVLIVFNFYLINFIVLIKNKTLFYDKFIKIQYVSTIS